MAHETRRLIAVLVADVVGYTQRMRADEADTFARLKALRQEVFEPALAAHEGRLVKTTGDGALVEFNSVVAAVNCGMAVQQTMVERSRAEPPGAALLLRIGIDAGEVIVDDDDLYGDAVNIAARLQSLSPEGGMCLSARAFDQVRGRLELPGLEDIGDCEIRGLEQPVAALICRPGGTERAAPAPWQMAFGRLGATVARRDTPDAEHRPPAGVPSIAVLPFDNLGGDREQVYFADGITEDITTELSRFRQIFVISRLSAFSYRNSGLSAKAIGQELGVDYVLEGSVRRAGNRVRVNVQLIAVVSEHHIWAERYDRQFTDLFELQDEITGTVVATLVERVEYDRMRDGRLKRPENLDAYDLVLQGLAIHRDGNLTYQRACQAVELFRRATEADPNYSRAHAWHACSSARLVPADVNGEELTQQMRAARQRVELALSLDENDSEAHRILAGVMLFTHDFERSERHIRRALELSPNDAHITVKAGAFYCYAGKPDIAEPLIRRAMRLNPHHPDWYWLELGLCLFVAGDAAASNQAFWSGGQATASSGPFVIANFVELGDVAQAREQATALREADPEFSAKRFVRMHPFQRVADRERLETGLRAVGLLDDGQEAAA